MHWLAAWLAEREAQAEVDQALLPLCLRVSLCICKYGALSLSVCVCVRLKGTSVACPGEHIRLSGPFDLSLSCANAILYSI